MSSRACLFILFSLHLDHEEDLNEGCNHMLRPVHSEFMTVNPLFLSKR